MKKCSRCNTDKEPSEFRKRSKSNDGLSVWCRPCFAEYERERYQNGDKARKERNKAAVMKRAREYIWQVLSASSCIDCGNSDPLVLEFDHRDDVTKVYNVSEMQMNGVDRIKEEIAKCDIRCSNCHKKRTIRQFGFWRGNM